MSTFQQKLTRLATLDPTPGALVSKFMREVKRLSKGEPVTEVTAVGSRLIAFTTELGMYRIWDAYTNKGKNVSKMSRGFSPANDSYYVALEVG